MMSLNHFKKSGQSAVELSLIAALVVGVSWSGLQLLNDKMTQGTSAFAAQYSGTAVATSGSSSGVSSPIPTSASSGASTSTPTLTPSGVIGVPQTVGVALPSSPIQTTGSNAAVVNPNTVTATTPASTPVSPVLGLTTGGGGAGSSTSTANAQPAAGDGCMGCAASMTTDLGW